jgi:hypothetical protein
MSWNSFFPPEKSERLLPRSCLFGRCAETPLRQTYAEYSIALWHSPLPHNRALKVSRRRGKMFSPVSDKPPDCRLTSLDSVSGCVAISRGLFCRTFTYKRSAFRAPGVRPRSERASSLSAGQHDRRRELFEGDRCWIAGRPHQCSAQATARTPGFRHERTRLGPGTPPLSLARPSTFQTCTERV